MSSVTNVIDFTPVETSVASVSAKVDALAVDVGTVDAKAAALAVDVAAVQARADALPTGAISRHAEATVASALTTGTISLGQSFDEGRSVVTIGFNRSGCEIRWGWASASSIQYWVYNMAGVAESGGTITVGVVEFIQ